MLSIEYIIQNIAKVREAAKCKNIHVDLELLINLYKRQKDLKTKIDALRHVNNITSKPIHVEGSVITGKLPETQVEIDESSELEDSEELYTTIDTALDKVWHQLLKSLELEYKDVRETYHKLMLTIPNIMLDDVPIGESDRNNIEWSHNGTIPQFDFPPQDHITLGQRLHILGVKEAVNISSPKMYFLQGAGVLLEMAVLQFALHSMIEKGFTPYAVPLLVKPEALQGTGYFPGGEEQAYHLEKDDLYLIGTSEVALCGLHMNTLFDGKDLPLRLTSLSPCFRREAGTYGRDSQGLYRVHQFQKVEQVIIAENDPEQSIKLHFELLHNAEEILQKLELPYRVVKVCSGDLGMGQVLKHDIETWIPSRNSYGETHSCSSFHDFQARRLNIQYTDKDKKKHYAYTLNNTSIASPRILIAILEHYQQPDGSIRIPEVLRPYMNNANKIT